MPLNAVFNAPVGMPLSTAGRPASLRPISLNRSTYLVLLLIVIPAGAFMVWEQLFPSIYYYRCIESVIPSAQGRLGFTFGPVVLPETKEQRLALIEVKPNGPLGRAGFRSGDIPVAHHGGVTEFCGALGAAEEGEAYGINVINLSDWSVDGPDRRRTLYIPKGK